MNEKTLNLHEMHKKVRTLFQSSMGKEVLTYLLWRLSFFNSSLKSSEDIIRHNFAMELIEMVGPGKTRPVINTIVDSILNLELED